MSRRGAPYGRREIEDMGYHQAHRDLRQRPPLTQRWSETDEEYFARMDYGHPRPAESRQGGVHQETYPGYSSDEYDQPPPYYERDEVLSRGVPSQNDFLATFHGGRRPDCVTDRTDRRDRYDRDEHGERGARASQDYVDSSEDDGESYMIPLESGRPMPRHRWEANHQWDASSGDSAYDTDEEVAQRRRGPMPQRRNNPYAEHGRRDREAARMRNANGGGARRGRGENYRAYGEQSHNMESYNLAREMPRRRNSRRGRHQGRH